MLTQEVSRKLPTHPGYSLLIGCRIITGMAAVFFSYYIARA
jgi:hypothetical protein